MTMTGVMEISAKRLHDDDEGWEERLFGNPDEDDLEDEDEDLDDDDLLDDDEDDDDLDDLDDEEDDEDF